MNALDTLSYTNRLRHLPPWQKLLFGAGSLLLALGSHPPVQLAIAGWLSFWTVHYAGVPAHLYRRVLLGIMAFLATSLPVLILNLADHLPADAVWGIPLANWQLYLSHRGLAQASEIFCRSLASTACLLFIAFTIPLIELSLLFARLGCPAILVELLLLAYRFIFLLTDTVQRLLLAQTARGGYRTRQLTLKSASLLIRGLLQRTVERYQQLTLGVRARGFNHQFRFWQPQLYRYSQRHMTEILAGWLGLLTGELLTRIYG
ncbi:MAG: cobalt ECF transporter T component CbiQ [Pegethrix bostrychoides GSE-TBD4-15B]|jgi:cobalt/nickel transport system permease protein|uniref:Cobalt ECF transporter T component CbiQ n=1 Tax=Pegethrix bostrychoides GSE-TBD4-15B TaxID=2839662 RepID=A0A951PCW5_9CYAN|nr:cobalt ECF transporter T component CbiQ [Pegethrix bostrychoides GSE-TBD4-15B]